MDWFTTMIIVANHDNTKVCKKLLLLQDLKLDKAKAICKEEENTVKTSCMLGASRTTSSDNYGSSQVQSSESAAGALSYQYNRGRGNQNHGGHGGQCGGCGGFQQQDRGRSQSRECSDSQNRSECRDRSASRDQNTSSCYRCGRSHQSTCPAIDKKCHNCLKMGHYATNCRSHKAMASATSTSSAPMGQLTITSAHNPEKLALVEIKVKNINGRREKAKFLPDTGANITAF